jgi:CDP-glucose 4,6-dehydratase
MEIRECSLEGLGITMIAASSSFWHHRRVFMTGCSGLLGSWLAQELVARGASVVGLVRDWQPGTHLTRSGLDRRITTVRGEVEDLELLTRTIAEYRPECVFHLAAQAIVEVAQADPLSTFRTNIAGTWNLLEACRRIGGIGRIIVASSDKAYGEAVTLPYDEQTPLRAEHPYDVSKACADLISRTYYESYGLPVCVTRCGNFYGGGDLNFTRLVPATIQATLQGVPLVLRSDGTFIRDYFYGALAYLHLAEYMEDPKIWGEAFNFSNEQQIPVIALVRQILELMGRTDLAPVLGATTCHEIRHQYLSAEKARTWLDWRPHYSLEEGLIETIAWYREYLELPLEKPTVPLAGTQFRGRQ